MMKALLKLLFAFLLSKSFLGRLLHLTQRSLLILP